MLTHVPTPLVAPKFQGPNLHSLPASAGHSGHRCFFVKMGQHVKQAQLDVATGLIKMSKDKLRYCSHYNMKILPMASIIPPSAHPPSPPICRGRCQCSKYRICPDIHCAHGQLLILGASDPLELCLTNMIAFCRKDTPNSYLTSGAYDSASLFHPQVSSQIHCFHLNRDDPDD